MRIKSGTPKNEEAFVAFKRTFTVDHPDVCPWRASTCCTYRYGGYANPVVVCGPYLPGFPINCPMTNIVGDPKGFMVGLVNTADIKASSDYELICIIRHTLDAMEQRLTKRESFSSEDASLNVYGDSKQSILIGRFIADTLHHPDGA
jgi:hypothetical protein